MSGRNLFEWGSNVRARNPVNALGIIKEKVEGEGAGRVSFLERTILVGRL